MRIKIDFKLLNKQKATLLNIIHTSKEHNITKKETKHLTGILHLIDNIQDTAVENGISEKEVFPNLG